MAYKKALRKMAEYYQREAELEGQPAPGKCKILLGKSAA
jgi:hypothetical protein